MFWIPTAASRPPGFPSNWSNWSALGENRVVARTLTNHDGRTDQPLIGGLPVPIGNYELRFKVADYFASKSVPLSDPPFLDSIPLRFRSAIPKVISTCHCWSRPGAMRPIGGVEHEPSHVLRRRRRRIGLGGGLAPNPVEERIQQHRHQRA